MLQGFRLNLQSEIKEFIVTTIEMIPKITNAKKITLQIYVLAEESMENGGMLRKP
jgi:hypothetical protein